MQITQPLPIKKIIVILFVFTICITLLRITWLHMNQPHEQYHFNEGKLDLSAETLSDDEIISLGGKWSFFPNEFIDPIKTHHSDYFIDVPEVEGDLYETNGLVDEEYASFQLTIDPPPNVDQFGISFSEIHTAFNVYVNGKLMGEHGNPSSVPEVHKGKLGALTTFIPNNGEPINIIVHVSNYELPFSDGIVGKVIFGSSQAINKETTFYDTLQLITCLILLLHSLYAFILFFFGVKRKQLIYFGLLVFTATLSTALDDGRILSNWMTLDPVWTLKTLYVSFYLMTLFSFMFIHSILTLNKRIYTAVMVIYTTLSVLMIVLPVSLIPVLLPIGLLLNVVSYSYLFIYFLIHIKDTSFERLFILLSMIAICSNIIWGAVINLNLIEITYYPFDLLIAIFSFSFFLFMHYNQLSKQHTILAHELMEMDKVRDEFLANTSHELRNPLHGIMNIAQNTLDEEEGLSTQAKENLALLIDVGKRMGYTINDLSTITQLRDKRIRLHKSPVQLQIIVPLVIDMLEFLKGEKAITLETKIPEKFPAIHADENRLIQILFNLVHNAIKFTEEGSITIEANTLGKTAVIYVKDTGIGILQQTNIASIFEAYERVEEGHAGIASGIGIGLSVCKQLIELHGGMITYHSTENGTTFEFTLPLADETEPLPDASAYEEIASTIIEEKIVTKPEQPLDKSEMPSVLIVDDDPVNIKVLQQILTPDYTVHTALSAKEALQQIGEHHLDLIVSDVMMPYMSGYELTRNIRKRYTISELPVLLVTARGLQEDIETAFDCGANDYLLKPVNTLELKTRVEALTKIKDSVKKLLKFEAAWLQAQIQPHFLFNTLNSIASLAEIDTDRMIGLLEAFGAYLQKSFALSNLEAERPLADELDLADAYIHIEKERFGDRLRVECDVDEELDVLIPPLSIQPLVENAIMHGVLQKAAGGTVWVKVKEKMQNVEIIIEDDGVGMSPEKIKGLLDPHQFSYDGVGVKNTNRRLIQLYGKGLEISSTVNAGTRISFTIPI